jgi:hypothetical protein
MLKRNIRLSRSLVELQLAAAAQQKALALAVAQQKASALAVAQQKALASARQQKALAPARQQARQAQQARQKLKARGLNRIKCGGGGLLGGLASVLGTSIVLRCRNTASLTGGGNASNSLLVIACFAMGVILHGTVPSSFTGVCPAAPSLDKLRHDISAPGIPRQRGKC